VAQDRNGNDEAATVVRPACSSIPATSPSAVRHFSLAGRVYREGRPGVSLARFPTTVDIVCLLIGPNTFSATEVVPSGDGRTDAPA
jgi:hypothetical protein